MARTLYSFTNRIKWVNDLPSWRKVKKEAQQLGKEIGDLYKPTIPSPDMPRSPRQPRRRLDDNDAHIKQYRKLNMEQEKFAKLQQTVIKRFSISNKEIREMGELERRSFIAQLKQAKTKDELLFTERKLKAEIADRLRNEKRLTKEKNKQTLAQRRLTSSTEQMAGSLVSVYALAASGQAITRAGMDFESFEKTFLAVSDGVEDAKDQMEFARQTAQYFGSDLIETGKAYSRMIGAVGDKAPLQDVRDIFLATNEAAVVLGLSADDTTGSLRA
ncbi:hypothetical protein [Vibrio phage vB_VibM_10AMN]|uniref:Tail tape measure protein n=1 Tax=Staphylococcus phage vB_VibM_10AMN12 TaxID=3076785 RepID=A0AA96KSH8_9CAUD|nr:hypothetical protein [Vibrio phage vB_VibM_10AMN]WNO47467.1 hypothetical protein [Staphylococcus phage vB_VibM_10AMN12]